MSQTNKRVFTDESLSTLVDKIKDGDAKVLSDAKAYSDSHHAKLTDDNTFSGDNTFTGETKFVGNLVDKNGNIGTPSQILTSTNSGVEWKDPSSIYPVINLDDLMLDDCPSGIMTQNQVDSIMRAGGFYVTKKNFAPLIITYQNEYMIQLTSTNDWVEDGFVEIYQLVIHLEDLTYETFYRSNTYFTEDTYRSFPTLNNDNTFERDNNFNGQVTFNGQTNLSGELWDYDGNSGVDGQVLTSDGLHVWWRDIPKTQVQIITWEDDD